MKSNSQVGLPFWRQLRQELEAKKKYLVGGSHEDAVLSEADRRDLLWHAVREVDDQFSQKYACKIEEGTTYSKDPTMLQNQAIYKTRIGSARECALICAADPLGVHGDHKTPCKSFTYNKTVQECKFFSFAQKEHSTRVKDTCCTSGPPCNLNSMREEIQKEFEAELKRAMSSQKQLAAQLKKASDRLADEKKTTQRLSFELHSKQVTMPTNQVSSTTARRVALKVETKPVPTTAKLEQKHVPQTKQEPLSDHLSHHPAAGSKHATAYRQRWILACIIIMLFHTVAFALYLRYRVAGGSLKQLRP